MSVGTGTSGKTDFLPKPLPGLSKNPINTTIPYTDMELVHNTAYEHKTGLMSYCGLVLDAAGFGEYMATTVNSRFYDSEGTTILEGGLADINVAKFDSEVLNNILKGTRTPTPWKIGETIAECFLKDHRDSVFPYNNGRDETDPNSSLPGTDLVGFVMIDGRTMFLFCEVKTSDQKRSPPSLVYGEDGLGEQIKRLEHGKKQEVLIRWLGLKVAYLANDEMWKNWQHATQRYIDYSELKICGVMIRGTAPDMRDLQYTFDHASSSMKQGTYFELLALYLPIQMTQYANTMGPSK